MIYKVGILIEELIDEDDEIQGETWYRRMAIFETEPEAQQFVQDSLDRLERS